MAKNIKTSYKPLFRYFRSKKPSREAKQEKKMENAEMHFALIIFSRDVGQFLLQNAAND